MTEDRTEARDARSEFEAEGLRGMDAAISELLDHIVGELAREYVRLMEQAAGQEQARTSTEDSQED